MLQYYLGILIGAVVCFLVMTMGKRSQKKEEEEKERSSQKLIRYWDISNKLAERKLNVLRDIEKNLRRIK